jgi:hypothetical protein
MCEQGAEERRARARALAHTLATENMKRRITIQFFAVTVVNIGVVVLIPLATRLMAYHWGFALDNKPLPLLTELALSCGTIWPVAILLLSCSGFLLSVRAKWNDGSLHACFLVLVLTEIILLGLHVYAFAAPSVTIMYELD